MRRRSKLVPVLALWITLLVGGCASDNDVPPAVDGTGASSSTTESDEVAEEPAAPEREPAANPCLGARGTCEVVAAVDVDGDGNSDNVGIELVDDRITVRVDIGGGSEVSTASVPNQYIFPEDVTPSGVFVGAFHITRDPGSDIVIDSKMGLGGFELFGVFGWNNGLVPIPAPAGATSVSETAYMWAVPTEMFRVFVRCPDPGSVGVVTTEADSSFGIVTPGGAYNETVTSRWSGDQWIVGDTNRVPGEYVSDDRSALTGTFECEPTQSDPPAFARIAPPENPNIVFGGAPLSNSKGYGEIRPATVYFGGSPSGFIGDIVWDSWGGEQAIGHGQAPYVTPTGSVADAQMTPAEIVAFEPTFCNGTSAYSKVQWYFPGEGGTFDTSLASAVC